MKKQYVFDNNNVTIDGSQIIIRNIFDISDWEVVSEFKVFIDEYVRRSKEEKKPLPKCEYDETEEDRYSLHISKLLLSNNGSQYIVEPNRLELRKDLDCEPFKNTLLCEFDILKEFPEKEHKNFYYETTIEMIKEKRIEAL